MPNQSINLVEERTSYNSREKGRESQRIFDKHADGAEPALGCRLRVARQPCLRQGVLIINTVTGVPLSKAAPSRLSLRTPAKEGLGLKA